MIQIRDIDFLVVLSLTWVVIGLVATVASCIALYNVAQERATVKRDKLNGGYKIIVQAAFFAALGHLVGGLDIVATGLGRFLTDPTQRAVTTSLGIILLGVLAALMALNIVVGNRKLRTEIRRHKND